MMTSKHGRTKQLHILLAMFSAFHRRLQKAVLVAIHDCVRPAPSNAASAPSCIVSAVHGREHIAIRSSSNYVGQVLTRLSTPPDSKLALQGLRLGGTGATLLLILHDIDIMCIFCHPPLPPRHQPASLLSDTPPRLT